MPDQISLCNRTNDREHEVKVPSFDILAAFLNANDFVHWGDMTSRRRRVDDG